MTTFDYNPSLVAKLLERAGHPSTYDNEALFAVRKAYEHCAKAGKTLSEAIVIDVELYLELSSLPKKSYLEKLADAKLAIAAKDEEIARINQRVAAKDTEINNLKAASAALAADIAARDAQLADRDAHIEVLEAQLRTEEAQRDRVQSDDRADVLLSEDARPIARAPASAASTPALKLRWTRRVRDKLRQYARAGMTAAMIARRLSREFKRCVATSKVAEMMRGLWIADAEGFYWSS